MRIKYIDSIKGISLVMIFGVHCAGVISCLSEYTTYGQLGVELFLICNGILSEIGISRERRMLGWKWLLKRAFRIVPLLWISMLFSFFLKIIPQNGELSQISFLLYNNPYATCGGVISTAFLINFVNPNWGYLSLFTCTYSVVTLMFWLENRFFKKSIGERGLIITISGIMLLFLPNVLLQLSGSTIVFYYFQYILRGIFAFWIGTMCTKYILSEQQIFNPVFRSAISVLSISVMAYLIVFQVTFDGGCSMIFTIASCLIIILQKDSTWKILDNSFWRFIGKYSFAFYFSHQIIFYFLSEYIISKIVLLMSSFAVSLAVSIVLTELFEKPTISLLRKLFKL